MCTIDMNVQNTKNTYVVRTPCECMYRKYLRYATQKTSFLYKKKKLQQLLVAVAEAFFFFILLNFFVQL